MAALMPTPLVINSTVAGVFGPLVGAKIWTYESGTRTPKDTYTDSTASTVAANPVITNARGEAYIWLGAGKYTIVITAPDGVEIKTIDGVSSDGAEAAAAAQAAADAARAVADGLLNVAKLYTLLENNRVPIGAILPFGAATVPSGYLPCNGSNVSRETYAGLFAVIGTTFGVGNGTTTFTLPDLRGEFLRGLDAGRGVDSGRVIGAAQGFAQQNIIGTFDLPTNTTIWDTKATGVFSASAGTTGFSGLPTAGNTPRITLNTSGQVATAAEVRPRNVAVPFIIKAYDAVLSGANPPPAVQTETTTARTLSLADRNTYIRCTNAGAVTITVPTEAAVGFSVGDEVHFMQAGDGAVTAAGASGVTLGPGTALTTAAKGKAFTLKKVATNTWDIFGGLA